MLANAQHATPTQKADIVSDPQNVLPPYSSLLVMPQFEAFFWFSLRDYKWHRISLGRVNVRLPWPKKSSPRTTSLVENHVGITEYRRQAGVPGTKYSCFLVLRKIWFSPSGFLLGERRHC